MLQMAAGAAENIVTPSPECTEEQPEGTAQPADSSEAGWQTGREDRNVPP